MNDQSLANLCQLDMVSLGKGIQDRSYTSVQVTTALLAEIRKSNPTVNAYVEVMESEAISSAARADEEIAQGRYLGPLHGVPVALKDMINTAGVRTTMGSPIYKDHVPGEDAGVVERLTQAGAIIVGKLNMHQFAFGATGDRSYQGPARNPHSYEHVTGGSSSGSGAALAANLAYATIGTDTGGSIRIPASCCGIVGMKPTFGSVSKAGVFPLSWTLDHIGPMTRTVHDNALFLNALVGHDLKDPYSTGRPEENFARQIGKPIEGMTIGIPSNFYFDVMDSEVRRVFDDNVKKLESRGATLKVVTIDYVEELLAAHQTILAAEAYASLETEIQNHAELFDQEVLTRTIAGAAVDARLYLRMLQVKHLGIQAHNKVFEQVNALITPTLCITPPKIGQRELIVDNKALHARVIVRMVAPTNVIGFPAISVPGGWAGELPMGIQLIGKPYSESELYRIAHHIEN